MDKRILKEIAKRWCKGVLEASETMMSFDESGLSDEETSYLQDQVKLIAERITPLASNPNTDELVAEYYDFD